MRETVVRLDGWCEGGLGQQCQQRTDNRGLCPGHGCATMRERSKEFRFPVSHVTE